MTRGPYRKSSTLKAPRTLGARIKKVRVKWGWSQARMAEELGTGQQALSRWERDEGEPTKATLRALQGLFGLSEEALLTGAGFSLPDPPAQVGALRVADAYARDLVILPEVPGMEGKVVLVVRQGLESTHEVMDPTAGRAAMKRALDSGKRVWVVIEVP